MIPARHRTAKFVLAITLGLVAIASAQETCKRVRTFAVDPVELLAGREVKGDDSHAVAFGMYNYHFVSAANKTNFEKNPEKHSVQLGGACARMGPLSGYGRGDIYAVHAGRIYLFASKQCRESFLKAPEKLLETVDTPPPRNDAAEKRGRELIELAIKRAGGAQLDAIHSYRHTIARTEKHGETDYKIVNSIAFAFPDRIRREESWNDSTYGQVVIGDAGFGIESKSVEDMPLALDQVHAVKRIANRTPIAILRARSRADFLALADGSQTVGVAAGERVIVYFDRCKMTLVIDPNSGRLVALETRMRSPNMTIGDAQFVFAEETTADGITLPSAWRISFGSDAADAALTKLTTIEVNPNLSASLFEQPKP